MRHYAIYLCPFTVPSSLANLIDCLQAANRRSSQPLFELTLIGEAPGPFGRHGVNFAPEAGLEVLEHCDGVIIPAHTADPDELKSHCGGLLAKLPHLAAQGKQLISACAGSFLLAASGVLDGRRATTHWSLQGEFRALFPKVKLVFDELVERDGPCITSGGGTGSIDLSLALIDDAGGTALAKAVAAAMLFDYRRGPQSAYFPLVPTESRRDPVVGKAQRLLAVSAHQEIRIEVLADTLNVSSRTLLRRFKSELGISPQQYLQRLRLDDARQRLEVGTQSIEQVIAEVGYEDRAAFTRLFKRHFGVTPAVFRGRNY